MDIPSLHYMSIQLNLLTHHIRTLEVTNSTLLIENARLTASVRSESTRRVDSNPNLHELWKCLESSLSDSLIHNVTLPVSVCMGVGDDNAALSAASYCADMDLRFTESLAENKKLTARCKGYGKTVRTMRSGLRDARGEIEILRERVGRLEIELKEERRLKGEEKTIRCEFEKYLIKERRESGSRMEMLKGENEVLKVKLEEFKGKWERRERIVKAGVEKWQEAIRKLKDRIAYLENVRSSR